MAAPWKLWVSTPIDFVSCVSAKSIGTNQPWIAPNVSHRLQHNSRCQPADQQDGVARRQPKRDQGWILSSEAPSMCAVCRHGTYYQTIDGRPVEQSEREVCPRPRSCRCYCCDAKTVSSSWRVTANSVLRVAYTLLGIRLVIRSRRHRITAILSSVKLKNGESMTVSRPAAHIPVVGVNHCRDKMCMCVEATITEMRLCEKEGL
jgi:hypothetical protein